MVPRAGVLWCAGERPAASSSRSVAVATGEAGQWRLASLSRSVGGGYREPVSGGGLPRAPLVAVVTRRAGRAAAGLFEPVKWGAATASPLGRPAGSGMNGRTRRPGTEWPVNPAPRATGLAARLEALGRPVRANASFGPARRPGREAPRRPPPAERPAAPATYASTGLRASRRRHKARRHRADVRIGRRRGPVSAPRIRHAAANRPEAAGRMSGRRRVQAPATNCPGVGSDRRPALPP